MNNIQHILQTYWGYDKFRPMQEEIISSILLGRDTLALLPTGGGKSLCFQVPAMAMEGLCLVVSPLIALMKDQVETLRKKGITAYSITSEHNRNEARQILITAGESNCKFLYVSPERLKTSLFQEYLFSLGISLIAVDEAHCISQWGYDFRPAYLQIATLRESLPDVPVIAVTASATPEVQTDICEKLMMQRPYIFRGSFLRPSLSFRTFNTGSKTGRIIDIFKKNEVSGIIYCRSRNKTQELAELLSAQGIRADFYHAGLSSEERIKKQDAWMHNEILVMACTNAFGMGIDKADVRIVIHHDMPDCLENYYQEAGRAGRDGQKAYAILLHNETDHHLLNELSTIRFPSIQFIRQVYRDLVNYLQIPAQTELEDWIDFDMDIFIERFELPLQPTLYALQQLEQEGWLVYVPKTFMPSKAEFTANKELLEAFLEQNTHFDPLIKTLLRTYGGILDMEVIISEYTIARILGLSKEAVAEGLKALHHCQIIHYKPQKNTPQIRFTEIRPVSDEWLVQPQYLLQRKQRFEKRASAMMQYAESTNMCRSVILANYFGDTGSDACGICDNCIAKKKKEEVDFNSFHSIIQALKSAATEEGVELKAYLNNFSQDEKEKIMDVINHLLDEAEAIINEKGSLIFK
ncbi:MAG: ATP-dependent DNA helicase RecQ [Bacteroidota bacterium]